MTCFNFSSLGKGGKNRRRGKNENEKEKRELVFKEDGQGKTVKFLNFWTPENFAVIYL